MNIEYETHFVYCLSCDKKIFYIGITDNPITRFSAHKRRFGKYKNFELNIMGIFEHKHQSLKFEKIMIEKFSILYDLKNSQRHYLIKVKRTR